MVELKTTDVSDKLRALPTKLMMTPNQQHLLDESIRCIECEAYRAGAVMGWNLAYDYIRQWVFNNRLADFNGSLIILFPRRLPIADYSDWFSKDSPSEREFLDVCSHQQMTNGPIIGGELFDHLTQYLRYRNKYAHASETLPSADKTNGYLEHLIDIITNAPFT